MGPHQYSGADDEGGSGELSSGSVDIRGGPGHGVDSKGAQSSGQLRLPWWSDSGSGALVARFVRSGGSRVVTPERRTTSLPAAWRSMMTREVVTAL
jgi:hypothetical protein